MVFLVQRLRFHTFWIWTRWDAWGYRMDLDSTIYIYIYIYMVLPCMGTLDALVYCPLAEADGVSETLLQEFARHDVNALWETVPWQHQKDFTMI